MEGKFGDRRSFVKGELRDLIEATKGGEAF